MPPASANVSGWFIPIKREHMVINRGGNCGFCSIEIIGKHLGIESLHGFSNGKGGCTASSMASWLDRYDIEYINATDRTNGYRLMRQFLALGKPVLFSIPGHALVCCGWTQAADGREFFWVVDNTGREAAQIKGWPKAEFERRFDGWVCGIVRGRLFPLRPRPSPSPSPSPSPGPHVDPAPGLVPQPAPQQPAPQPGPDKDKMAALEMSVAELKGRLQSLETTVKVSPDKVAPEVDKRLSALEHNAPMAAKLAEDAAVSAAKSEVSPLKARLDALGSIVDRAVAVADRANDAIPVLKGIAEKAKDAGLLSEERHTKIAALLEKIAPYTQKVEDVAAKIAEAKAEIKAAKEELKADVQGATASSGFANLFSGLAGGTGFLGALLGIFAFLRKNVDLGDFAKLIAGAVSAKATVPEAPKSA